VAISNFAQGNYSLVALVKPATNTGTEAVIGAQDGSSLKTSLVQESSNIGIADDVNVYVANVTRATVWEVCVVRKATGTSGTMNSRKALGSGSWSASTSTATTAGVAGTPSLIEIGSALNGNFGLAKDCRLAVAAIFDRVISQAEYEGIETAATTQSIYDLTPLALWDFNQDSTATAVVDLIGTSDQSAISGTTVIADGVDDPAWTFGIASGIEKVGSGIVGP
jgi:hypothetical protein